jgi:hypothetical protein
MRRNAHILILTLIFALLPLRSIASAMPDSCAGHDPVGVAQTAHAHCPAFAVLPAVALPPLVACTGERGTVPVATPAPNFIPDPLDPPPLPALR